MVKFNFVASSIGMTSFSFAPGRSGGKALVSAAAVVETVFCARLTFLVLVAKGPLDANPRGLVALTGVEAKDTAENGFAAAAGAVTVDANDVLANGLLDAFVGVKAGAGVAGIAADGVLIPTFFFHLLNTSMSCHT